MKIGADGTFGFRPESGKCRILYREAELSSEKPIVLNLSFSGLYTNERRPKLNEPLQVLGPATGPREI